MKRINGTVEKNGYSFYAILTETLDLNYITTNTTKVNYEIYLVNGNTRTQSNNWTFNAKIDGNNVYNKTGQTVASNSVDFGEAYLVFSGSEDIEHDTDGSKTITFSAMLSKTTYTTYDPGLCELSGTFVLTTIPRYANFISHSINKVSQTGIEMTWSADADCDLVEYSLNNGEWITASETTDSTYRITNLLSGAGYSVRTRIRHAGSGLYTISDSLSTVTKRLKAKYNNDGTWKDVAFYVHTGDTYNKTLPYINVDEIWNHTLE